MCTFDNLFQIYSTDCDSNPSSALFNYIYTQANLHMLNNKFYIIYKYSRLMMFYEILNGNDLNKTYISSFH